MSKNFSRKTFLSGGMGALALTPHALSAQNRADNSAKGKRMITPKPQQLAWQQAELSMFVHFGVNTFTNREWGDGKEDPRIFNPTKLDARQWVQTAKEAGFRYMILTAKHHDGFCLWQSKYTEHSVKNSPWRDGKGDVVREFTDACREAKIKIGLYLSPWDRHEPRYGDSPAYNRYYTDQMTELLTGYGDIAEIWLDGANGEGPNGKKQVYDFEAFKQTIRKYQPNAVIFAPIEMEPDIRWIGNESGSAGDPCWATFDAKAFLETQAKNANDPALTAMYQHGHANGSLWMPGETDVSIRPGWFWHKEEDAKVKPISHLVDIYYQSVGRNSLLLLNVPPNNEGLFAASDVARLKELRQALGREFAQNLAQGGTVTASTAAKGHKPESVLDGNANTYWQPNVSGGGSMFEVVLPKPAQIKTLLTQEYIVNGQRVNGYTIDALTDGGWKTLVRGETVGYKKLDRVAPVTAAKLRWVFVGTESASQIQTIAAY